MAVDNNANQAKIYSATAVHKTAGDKDIWTEYAAESYKSKFLLPRRRKGPSLKPFYSNVMLFLNDNHSVE